MEAIQLNEYSIDDFSNEDLITQLAQNIAEYTMRNMNLTHKGADAVRRVAPEYAEGMAARFVNDLHNEINVEIQVLIDDFVDDDRRGVVDPDESIEQINEVSDFDGESLDALIAQFEETCKKFRIGSFPRKQKDLLNVVMTRAKDTQDLDDLGHENALGNDHQPTFGGWPNDH